MVKNQGDDNMQLKEFLEKAINRCNTTGELLNCYMGPCNRQKIKHPIALYNNEGEITHISSGDSEVMIAVKSIVDMSFE